MSRDLCAGAESSSRGRIRLSLLGEAALILVLIALFVHLGVRTMSDRDGLIRTSAQQVAVITDYWSGSQRSVTTPGYEVIVPRLQEAQSFDRSPVEFRMEGNKYEAPNYVPRLLVRASDGSSFWFNSITIQYGLDPSKLELMLRHFGPGEEFKQGIVGGYARSILRDEFGRFDPDQIVKPENIQGALARSEERLGQCLARHGLLLYEISASKPGFDQQYEATIERAKVAEQEILGLQHDAFLLEAGAEARLQETRKRKELALKKAQAQWQQQLTALEKEAERLAEGQAEELAQLVRYQELALIKGRAKWQQELEELRRVSADLQRAQPGKLEQIRREKELELTEARTGWDAQTIALQEETRQTQEGRDSRLLQVRRQKELELEKLRGDWARERDEAEAVMAHAAFEAESYCRSKVLAGEQESERQFARAASLTERYRQEAEAFLARSESYAAHGTSAVRAALVEKLQSIVFEIVPVDQHRPAEDPPTPVTMRSSHSEL